MKISENSNNPSQNQSFKLHFIGKVIISALQNKKNYSRLPVIRTSTYSNMSIIRSDFPFPVDFPTHFSYSK